MTYNEHFLAISDGSWRCRWTIYLAIHGQTLRRGHEKTHWYENMLTRNQVEFKVKTQWLP